MGNVLTRARPECRVWNYAGGVAGSRLAATDPLGDTVTFQHDGPFSLSYGYGYDAAGRKTAFSGPDDVTVSYQYDGARHAVAREKRVTHE